jgi:DNA-binding NarL/FixJ family response regulator
VLLRELLEGVGYRTLVAEGGEEALAHARREQPCVAVLDVHLPGRSGYEVCRELRDTYGDAMPIVLVSGERVEDLDRVAGLLLGADEYLVKPFAPGELLARVRRLIERCASARGNGRTVLTPREHEVLALLASGLAAAEIAGRLVISPQTVRTHLERILRKLGVSSRGQAIVYAYQHGLVEGGPADAGPPRPPP